MIDGKEYAKQMRENAVIDDNGNILVSGELWQQIANIIVKQQAEIDKLNPARIMTVDIKLDETEIREQFEKIKTQKIICIDNTESIRAEGIKEFTERLKEKTDVWEDEENYFKYVTTDDIENLVKEMGADNDN